MKKLLAAILCGAMVLSLAACGGGSEASSAAAEGTGSTAAAEGEATYADTLRVVIPQDPGTLEPGKQADIVMVERDSINMFPCYNPYSALVYSAERANVDRVWVAGQERVRHGRLTGLDDAEIRRRLLEQMPDFLEKSREFASII